MIQHNLLAWYWRTLRTYDIHVYGLLKTPDIAVQWLPPNYIKSQC